MNVDEKLNEDRIDDWAAMDRLHQKGLLSRPQSKAKSVVFSEEGLKLAEERRRALFGTRAGG